MSDRFQQSIAPNNSYQYLFTVFTATYNRGYCLHRVCDSLKAQTYRNFEWLIVDDGSRDNTRELVENWQKENLFPIRYFFQENSGKHLAFNRGVREAKGELFLNFDSDDACLPTALERFKYHWYQIPIERKDRFSAVTCLCQDENGAVVGTYFPSDVIDSDSLEIRYKYKVKGEKWGFHRTEVLKYFPFPEIPEVEFVPEDIVWFQISQKYKTRFVNEPLRIYYTGEDQLTKTGFKNQDTTGVRLNHKNILNTAIEYFRFSPLSFLRSSVHYSRFSFHCGTPAIEQFKNLNNLLARVLWLVGLPAGYLVYLKDKLR